MEHVEIAEGIWMYPDAIEDHYKLLPIIKDQLGKTIVKQYLDLFDLEAALVLYPDGEEDTNLPLNNIFANMFAEFEKDYIIKNDIKASIRSPFSIVWSKEGSWYKTQDFVQGDNIRVMYVLSDDTDGGEYEFPKLNIKFKLKENSFYVFPEKFDSEYEILAEQIRSGSRLLILSLLG